MPPLPVLAPMPVLHINDQQYPLKPGPTRLGAPEAAEIPVAAGIGVQAIIDVQEGASPTIRRAAASTGDAGVRLNGVALGADPTPLLDGDRLEVGGVELRFSDDAPGRSDAFRMGAGGTGRAPGDAARGSVNGTGGRIVSLVDGREYAVHATGLVIGREVGADVVVPLAEVSRRHAEIVPTAEGYRLTDLSTNGVTVNGERVVQSRLLEPADVIRVATEEFRFYAGAPASAPAFPSAPGDVSRPAPVAAPVAAPGLTPSPEGRPIAEPSRPSAAPLTAGPPPQTVQPPPPSTEPVPEASGRMPFWLWLLVIVAIIAVSLVVMG